MFLGGEKLSDLSSGLEDRNNFLGLAASLLMAFCATSFSSDFSLTKQCPPGFLLDLGGKCRMKSLYLFYDSLHGKGLGGMKAGLPSLIAMASVLSKLTSVGCCFSTLYSPVMITFRALVAITLILGSVMVWVEVLDREEESISAQPPLYGIRLFWKHFFGIHALRRWRSRH